LAIELRSKISRHFSVDHFQQSMPPKVTPQLRGKQKNKTSAAPEKSKEQKIASKSVIIGFPMAAVVILFLGLLLSSSLNPFVGAAIYTIPPQAQAIDQKSFNVLETVPPPPEANATTACNSY